jgi:hypothetical protein
MKYAQKVLYFLVILILFSCEEKMGGSKTSSSAGQGAAWMLLFDGETLNGWRGLGRNGIPEKHWVVDNGTIYKVASGNIPVAADGQPLQGGDLLTQETYGNFEFKFEWKVSAGANSGVKYNVSEGVSQRYPPIHAALGFEYQVLDDDQHPDGQQPNHRTGGLYDLIAPNEQKVVNPVGEWNESLIVFNNQHGEHWLNGKKIVEYDLGSERMNSLVAASKYAKIANFAKRRRGHLVLQDHGDAVWYRNLKIRVLEE